MRKRWQIVTLLCSNYCCLKQQAQLKKQQLKRDLAKHIIIPNKECCEYRCKRNWQVVILHCAQRVLQCVVLGLAAGIVRNIHTMDPAGRFLLENNDTRMWFDIGGAKAIKKNWQGSLCTADFIMRGIITIIIHSLSNNIDINTHNISSLIVYICSD